MWGLEEHGNDDDVSLGRPAPRPQLPRVLPPLSVTLALPWLFGTSVPLIEVPFSFHLSSLLFIPTVKVRPVSLSPTGVLPNT